MSPTSMNKALLPTLTAAASCPAGPLSRIGVSVFSRASEVGAESFDAPIVFWGKAMTLAPALAALMAQFDYEALQSGLPHDATVSPS